MFSIHEYKYLIPVHVITSQIRIRFHTTNTMGSRNSKKKYNKEGEKQKLCKVGLGLGRNDLKVEGNFQLGYHSKINKKYEAVDGKPLPIIPEEEEQEENGRVPDAGVLQS